MIQGPVNVTAGPCIHTLFSPDIIEVDFMENRRRFLQTLTAVVAATPAGLAAAQQKPAPATGGPPSPSNPATLRKSTLISMLPRQQPYAERFAIARDAGFEAVEMQTIGADAEAAEIKEASAKTGLKIHSVMNADHWRFPLSSADPEVVSKCVAGMETSIKNAQLWGAEAVLLVPAVVNATTSYRDAWTRSQRIIRERLLPVARDQKIIIAVEEVWNKFLQSPLEFARYVDEFESPWVKAYFDVGNVVINGYPQDWIRTLGSRIVRIHLKDFKVNSRDRTVPVHQPRRRRHRLAGGPARARGDRLFRLRHDGDRWRRSGLPQGRRGPGRSLHRGREAGSGHARQRNRESRSVKSGGPSQGCRIASRRPERL